MGPENWECLKISQREFFLFNYHRVHYQKAYCIEGMCVCQIPIQNDRHHSSVVSWPRRMQRGRVAKARRPNIRDQASVLPILWIWITRGCVLGCYLTLLIHRSICIIRWISSIAKIAFHLFSIEERVGFFYTPPLVLFLWSYPPAHDKPATAAAAGNSLYTAWLPEQVPNPMHGGVFAFYFAWITSGNNTWMLQLADKNDDAFILVLLLLPTQFRTRCIGVVALDWKPPTNLMQVVVCLKI